MNSDPLRVLVANEKTDHIALVAGLVTALGHTVIAESTDVAGIGALTARTHPDVALVGLGTSPPHALELIDRIVREAECPVIALLAGRDPSFIDEAAKLGVFAYIVDTDAERLQSALNITLRRFAEYHDLKGAFDRRSLTERAKGIVMEREQISEEAAFDLFRDQARGSRQKLVDVAQAILDGHLLPPQREGDAPAHDVAERPERALPDDTP
jgi:AmiR/NasT family two-component response regulator